MFFVVKHSLCNTRKGTLGYTRSFDAFGDTWPLPQFIDQDLHSNTGMYTSLQIVSGSKAILVFFFSRCSRLSFYSTCCRVHGKWKQQPLHQRGIFAFYESSRCYRSVLGTHSSDQGFVSCLLYFFLLMFYENRPVEEMHFISHFVFAMVILAFLGMTILKVNSTLSERLIPLVPLG